MMQKKRHGFTLLEILIAVVVLSVGTLSVAALQLKALRENSGSYVRTQAILLAYDMADRMRANIDGVKSGDYETVATIQIAEGDDPPDDPNPDCDGDGGSNPESCNASELAAWDVLKWGVDLQTPNVIPISGAGVIACNACPQPLDSCNCTITVSWKEINPDIDPANGDDTIDQSVSFDFSL